MESTPSDNHFDARFVASLWAPIRAEYHKLPRPLPDFLKVAAETSDDRAHLVLARRRGAYLIMNRFPYSVGHLMSVPYRKVAEMGDLCGEEVQDLWDLTVLAQRLLRHALKAQGFNVGVNLGRCAGAGAPDHLHLHIVPRWEGDLNFMATLGKVSLLTEALDSLYERLSAGLSELGADGKGLDPRPAV